MLDAYMDNTLVAPGNAIVLRQCSYGQGVRFDFADAYQDQVAPRLCFHDGLSEPRRPAVPLDWLRLIYEEGGAQGVKIFGVVAGARLHVHGAEPSSPVTAEARVVTNQGREFLWRTVAISEPDGRAEFRVPYASGVNGSVLASVWTVREPGRTAQVSVTEKQLVLGQGLEVDLGSGD